ncbi:hypothetical protein V6N13_035576 [Hibiscus sabdariffa]
MARLWETGVRVVDGGASATRTEGFSGGFLMLWAALVALSLVTAILFSFSSPFSGYSNHVPTCPRAAAHPKPKPKPPVPVQVPTVPPAQLAAVDKH